MSKMDKDQKSRNTIPWSEKTARQKAASLGTILGLFLACTLLAYAIGQLYGQKSGTIDNTKGHLFEMDLTGVKEGVEIVPGTQTDLSDISVENKSLTENIYAFISFRFDPSVYKIADVTGWEVVEESSGYIVYSYSIEKAMTEVSLNDSAQFHGTLKCISDATSFLSLTDDDFVVDVTGYAISTEICSDGNAAAWIDYQNGGNQ